MLEDLFDDCCTFNASDDLQFAPTFPTLLYFNAERPSIKTRFSRCAQGIE